MCSLKKQIVILLLVCVFFLPANAQESAMSQFLIEHGMTIITETDSIDSFHDDIVLAALEAQNRVRFDKSKKVPAISPNPCVLFLDTICGSVELFSLNGQHLADVHFTLVDSTWYMWLSVDPLVDKNISSSPYMYCSGNPIMFFDPNGMDDYSIDGDGNIQMIKETQDKFDRLGTLNEDGNFNENNFVFIRDKSLLPSFVKNSETYKDQRGLSRIVNFAIGKYGREITKMFLFAANNSNVEWNLCSFSMGSFRRYGISTSHNDEGVLAAYKTDAVGVSERRLLFNIHSHCRENSVKGASTFGMSDIAKLRRMSDNFAQYRQQLPPHYVYHVQSGGLYYYTPNSQNYFIRNLNQFPNYSGLFFLIP